eukprot:1123452-Karenia_brevis.AAC.1
MRGRTPEQPSSSSAAREHTPRRSKVAFAKMQPSMEIDTQNLKRERGGADGAQKLHESDSSGEFHHQKKRGDESMISFTGSVEQAP